MKHKTKRGTDWDVAVFLAVVFLLIAMLIAMAIWVLGCAVVPKAEPPTLIEQVPEQAKILAYTLGEMPKTFGLLVLLFVGGLIFWGLTRSKWGWIIPASSAAGMWLIVAFARWAWLIGLIGIGLALFVLIWKAWEYQRERNENREEKEKK